MSEFDDYLDGFDEEPGYLDFAAFGPMSRAVLAEATAQNEALVRARYGAFDRLQQNVDRLRAAAAAVTGFRQDQITVQPSTTEGLTQAVYGVTGEVLLSGADYPSLPTAAVRAADAFHGTPPRWLTTENGWVTPELVREQLTSTTTAVAVSAVDARTGYVADLEGIRDVIGDRLLIVDAVQALGAVELPWTAADVVACSGQKWLRAGFGAAFLALSERAVHRLTPVLSGVGAFPEPTWDEVPAPPEDGRAFQLSHPDPVGAARLAAGLEEVAAVGVPAIADRLRERVAAVIDLADSMALPVVSPREEGERAGIVVLAPAADQLTPLAAALVNHGVSATIRQGRVRLSPHAGTTGESLDLLRTALLAFVTAARPAGR